MGAKLEQNKQKIEKASDIQGEGLKKGQDDVKQVQEVKSILERMPDAMDDDIMSAIENTRNAAKNEGSKHMESEVHSHIEKGYETANDAISEANDQSQRSSRAAEAFRQAGSASEFGKSSAESSAASSEGIAQEFSRGAEIAKATMNETEERFKEQLDELLS